MDKTEFLQLCQSLACKEQHALSAQLLPITRSHLSANNKSKMPVIWLETNDSGDNNIAFMNTTYPYLNQVFSDMIDLLYSNTFMAAQGKDALDLLHQAVRDHRGEFTLVVEGAIPTKDQGLYTVIARTPKGVLTALDALTWLGAAAKYVVAIGTCASFGGASAAAPNLTWSVSVSQVLKRDVINVSGCPVNPDWFVATLAHLIMYGKPELDEWGRPKVFYGFTVHQHCQRRSYFDKKDFAEKLGDLECMFSQGCMGPRTGADCPYRLWINHVSYPIKVNTPCIGCTNPSFPDGSAPFFKPLPQKSQNTSSPQPQEPSLEKGADHEPEKNPV